MTLDEWRTCSDPLRMLAWVRQQGRLTPRKARLFCVAVCRRRWPQYAGDPPSPTVGRARRDRQRRVPPPPAEPDRGQLAVEVAERYADGAATEAELRRAHNGFHAWVYMLREARSWWGQRVLEVLHHLGPLFGDDSWAYDFPPVPDDRAVLAAVSRRAVSGATVAAREAVRVADDFAGDQVRAAAEATAVVCGVLREVFHPHRTTPFDPDLRTPTVVALATTLYADRTFDRLPILADALEEAGCTDAELLGHLRGPGPFVRGDWALDLVLGRE